MKNLFGFIFFNYESFKYSEIYVLRHLFCMYLSHTHRHIEREGIRKGKREREREWMAYFQNDSVHQLILIVRWD